MDNKRLATLFAAHFVVVLVCFGWSRPTLVQDHKKRTHVPSLIALTVLVAALLACSDYILS